VVDIAELVSVCRESTQVYLQQVELPPLGPSPAHGTQFWLTEMGTNGCCR
jgi:hypothetical protein